MDNQICAWCGKPIGNWAYKYDDKYFCPGGSKRDKDGICLKNYLFEKFDKDIELDVVETEEDIMADELEKRRSW